VLRKPEISAVTSRIRQNGRILTRICIILLISSRLLAAADRPPNIVMLLADDLGWTGLRCFGSDFYETPHLDGLAESGMKLTHAYSACTVCSPTRASIMTGMYPARLRLTDFIAGQNRPWAKMTIPEWTKRLKPETVTVAEELARRGYVTALVGKWHLSARGQGSSSGPLDHGFQIAHMKPPQAKGYFLPDGFNREGESGSDYLTDYLTDQALSVIDENRDRPFFLYFAYHTPHTPIQGRKDLVQKFESLVRADAEHNNPTYAAMVSSLDQSIGRVLDRIEQHGLHDDTIVVFTSDNGGLTQRYGKLDHFTSNAPLRRGKGSAYEGGTRVPTIIRWPGITAPGSVSDHTVLSVDYFPTFLAASDSEPSERGDASTDGIDLTPLLRGDSTVPQRDLFWHYPHYHAGGDGPYSAIRSGDWKLIEFHEDKRLELYDLRTDSGESTNLAPDRPDVAASLLQKLTSWRERVNAQMPTENPNYDPKRETEVARRAE